MNNTENGGFTLDSKDVVEEFLKRIETLKSL